MANWSLTDERELLAAACRDSFRAFVKYAAGVALNPLGGWWTEETHGPLCDWLQGKAKEWLEIRAGTRPLDQTWIMLDAARNSAKTMTATKCLPLWSLLQDPNLAMVIDADDITQAIEFAEYPRKILSADDQFALFAWLYGNWQGSDWTKERFTVGPRKVNKTEATFETTSVETGKTGKHPDAFFIDDLVTIEKLREKGNWLTLAKRHFRSLKPALQPNAMVVMAATPYTDADVVTTAFRVEGIKEVFGQPLPKEYAKYVRENGRWYVYHLPGRDAKGKPTLPKVWSEARLTAYEAEDPSNYASQVMLRPGAGELVPLSFEQLEDILVDRTTVPTNLAISIHLDTAFKDPKRMGEGDESVIVVAGHLQGTGDVYFLECHGSNQWRDDQFIDELIKRVQYYKGKHKRILAITDERVIGGKHGIWRKYLQAAFARAGLYLPRFIEVNRAGTKKVGRITEAASYWIDGHVYMVRNAPGIGKLLEQMARIGVSAHDDYADAAADAFHPEFYRPIFVNEEGQPPVPRRPGDSILQGGSNRPSDDDMRYVYDQAYGGGERFHPRERIHSEDSY